MNGGKFRKAEALLWAKEDQASWEATAVVDEDVDWVQWIGKFLLTFDPLRTTYDWSMIEAAPEGIHVRQTQYVKLVKECLNGMYVWADKPLKDLIQIHRRVHWNVLQSWRPQLAGLGDRGKFCVVCMVEGNGANEFQNLSRTGTQVTEVLTMELKWCRN
ncbi:hypothetical protein DFH07DRAFT_772312 [Mycena maculata]|uniref:Uncharacterized protein n=1 Tax=Mycena maculata TaxID=230809 RepID=A0AAD7JBK9_9AGAR|nr:hypothetical protein DFH07DRAFT_772312 [Mycena maculata]